MCHFAYSTNVENPEAHGKFLSSLQFDVSEEKKKMCSTELLFISHQ